MYICVRITHTMAVSIVIIHVFMRKGLLHTVVMQSICSIALIVCMQVPAIMGMLGVWYNNFFGAQSHALLPYDQVISWLSTYTHTLNCVRYLVAHGVECRTFCGHWFFGSR